MSKNGRRWTVVLIVGVVLWSVVGMGIIAVHSYLRTPIGMLEPVTVIVKHGSTLKQTLSELQRANVIAHPRWLYLYARWTSRTALRAGEYLVEPQDTPVTVLDKLFLGKVKTEQFVVVEGQNRWLVRDALVAARWMSARDFDRLCDNAVFLTSHDIPGPTCEGYLFPETYTMARGLAPEAIFQVMFAMFHRVYGEVTAAGRGPLNFETRALTTLASIVEKETGTPEERPHIACVFYNRLTAKPAWRLETDPTTIYAATLADPHFDGNLKREHLHHFVHPYNTYSIYGLPPGPIANPSRAALAAVVAPSSCNDFFFVSMNNGHHIFCPTIGCHNKAVDAWQIHFKRPR